MQKILINRLAMISGISGLFLMFVSFFLGTDASQLTKATSNRFALCIQPIVIAIACIAIGIYIVNILKNHKGIEIKITTIGALVVYSLLFVTCIYFIIVHLTVSSDSGFLALARVRSSNFYSACVLIKYLLSFVSLPILGLIALFLAPNEEKRINKVNRIANPTCFGICAIFLLMVAITCFPGLNNSLIALSRFNGSSQYATSNSLLLMTHYNVNGLSYQQLSMIKDMMVGASTNNNEIITVGQMRYAITLLVSYLVVVVSLISWIGINLALDFKYGGKEHVK